MTLRILHDEQYTGTYTAGKNKTIKVGNPNRAKTSKEGWIRIPNHHPAIISQELFDAVQAQLPPRATRFEGARPARLSDTLRLLRCLRAR